MTQLNLMYKLPRQIESEQPGNDLLATLQARTLKLWDKSSLDIPLLEFTEALKIALRAARCSGRIVQGLEMASQALDNERRGLDLVKRQTAQGARISRLVLMARDGSRHFYRKADRLLEKHFPRVLGCMINADSPGLSSLLFGPETSAKLVLVCHKEDVSRILLALMQNKDVF
ncbi:MAG: hypothetical protein WCQ99_17195 [Pseudomonadota bacterium]